MPVDIYIYVLFVYIHVYFFIGLVGIVWKEIAFHIFNALILNTNMSDSTNNQAVRLGPLKPTPEWKCPVKFSVKPLTSSVSCHCQLHWLYVYCQLQYGAELRWALWQSHLSTHRAGVTQPQSFERIISRTQTQDMHQYFELHQCLFTYNEHINEGLCP